MTRAEMGVWQELGGNGHLQGILAIPFLINFQDCTVVILHCDRDFTL
jgi:hypothetical protein